LRQNANRSPSHPTHPTQPTQLLHPTQPRHQAQPAQATDAAVIAQPATAALNTVPTLPAVATDAIVIALPADPTLQAVPALPTVNTLPLVPTETVVIRLSRVATDAAVARLDRASRLNRGSPSSSGSRGLFMTHIIADPRRGEYAPWMESIDAGAIVKVADNGTERDGIVFDMPSAKKVVVAVVDRRRGPVFLTVHPRTLAERLEEGADDPALRRLLRRTPPPVHGGGRGGADARQGRTGFTRTAAHRTTGK
jgi:hypothetical protein